MRNLESLTAETLLGVSSPEALFSESIAAAKQEYRELARRWHPDHDKTATAQKVFAHVAELYHAALRKLRDADWNEPADKIENETAGIKRFRLKDGSIKEIRYTTARTFELGTTYIAGNYVAYAIEACYDDLFHNGCRQIKTLAFRDREMAAEMARCLPQIEDVFETSGASVVIVHKTPDQILLADILTHMSGRIDQIEHIGWILNVLLNLACYLQWSQTTHNAISPETLFVSPLRHSGMLLGGWWYSAPVGARLIALPDRSLKFIDSDVLTSLSADGQLDLELIKSVGRELLGGIGSDVEGGTGGDTGDATTLACDRHVPEPLVDWLQARSSGDAIQDYSSWKYEVLPQSFGPPKFVKLNLNSTDIYKEI